MRKMAEYLGLVDGGEYNDEFGTYADTDLQGYDDQASLRPVASNSSYDHVSEHTQTSYAAPVRTAAPLADVYRITTLHPITYNDARRIGEEFRSGTPVIMNLSDMDEADARRIVDFSAGLAFGLHGSIEKVTKGVFLLSPANVDIGAAARAHRRRGRAAAHRPRAPNRAHHHLRPRPRRCARALSALPSVAALASEAEATSSEAAYAITSARGAGSLSATL
jgi:cell division inhibitor SepF